VVHGGSLDAARPDGGRYSAAVALSDTVRPIFITIGSRQALGKTLNPDGNVVASGPCRATDRAAIDASLSRLGTDYVDLYQLHRVEPRVPIEDTWAALAETVTAGKTRYLGLSEVTTEQIKRAQAIHPVTTVQSELSLWAREVRAEVPYCKQHGIGFLAYSPLGSGFLTGRFTSFDELPAGDARRQWDPAPVGNRY
jgi:aryl-alcohol dehydrogenase-like predicted oxidoreductase